MPRVVLGASLVSAAIAAALGGSRHPANDAQPVAAAVAEDVVPSPVATKHAEEVTPALEVQPVSTTKDIDVQEPSATLLADLADGEIPVGTVVTVMVGETPVAMTITEKGAVTVLGERQFVHEVSIPLAGWTRITIVKVEKKGSQIITKGTAAGLENTSARTIQEVERMCTEALQKGEFGYQVPSFVTKYNGRLREKKTDEK